MDVETDSRILQRVRPHSSYQEMTITSRHLSTIRYDGIIRVKVTRLSLYVANTFCRTLCFGPVYQGLGSIGGGRYCMSRNHQGTALCWLTA